MACGLFRPALGAGTQLGTIRLLNTVTAKLGFHVLTAELTRYSWATA